MRPHRLYLYDDPTAREWHPFSPTRPVGELLFGTETLRARVERVFGTVCSGHIAGDDLLGFAESGAPSCTTIDRPAPEVPRLLINSRFVPGENTVALPSRGPALLVTETDVVGAWIPDGVPLFRSLLTGDGLPAWPEHRVAGRLLGTVWDLMAENADRIRMDASRLHDVAVAAEVHRIGSGPVAAAADAVIEPGVIIDTTAGPVVLASGARVQGPSRLTGPLYVGEDSAILGGAVESSSIGPCCRIRGEVQASVILGFSNKAHDGYLGHSVVGRWVNLGAMTTNSDLKNNYSRVRLLIGGRQIETGLLKVGCFLGDHVRTGIGTRLDTGTVVGTGSNLFGGGMPPRDVPPYSWCSGSEPTEYDLDRFLTTAQSVMARRDVRLDDGMRAVYRNAFAASAGQRAAARSG